METRIIAPPFTEEEAKAMDARNIARAKAMIEQMGPKHVLHPGYCGRNRYAPNYQLAHYEQHVGDQS